jgi:hypothetical protein
MGPDGEKERRRDSSIHDAAWRIGDAPKTPKPPSVPPLLSKPQISSRVSAETLRNLHELQNLTDSGLLDSDLPSAKK